MEKFNFSHSDLERFWRLVNIDPDGCWLWKACEKGRGYGGFQVDGALRIAHRWIYQVYNGPIDDSVKLLHKCDVRRCVRLSHLFEGYFRDNHLDALSKGRMTGRQKLIASQAEYIHDRYQDGQSVASLSRLFGVRENHIRRIGRGQHWDWQF